MDFASIWHKSEFSGAKYAFIFGVHSWDRYDEVNKSCQKREQMFLISLSRGEILRLILEKRQLTVRLVLVSNLVRFWVVVGR
jgi:hypothetical protein